VDDLVQILHRKLFVAEPERRPKISEYAGRGALRNWLRVTMVRIAINLAAKKQPEVPVDPDTLLEAPLEAESPELSYMKEAYRGEFKAAFSEAIAELSSRERNLLRHSFIDGVGIDGLSVIYGVHRATAARWLARARSTLMVNTRQRLRHRLGITSEELDSILRLIQSRLDVTLRGMLTTEEEK
jgi:RNA polymerase sigma-70 factor (ECF subfamily)